MGLEGVFLARFFLHLGFDPILLYCWGWGCGSSLAAESRESPRALQWLCRAGQQEDERLFAGPEDG